jgi:hypothetical protein
MGLFIDIARKYYHIDSVAYEDITSYDLHSCIDMDGAVVEEIIDRIVAGDFDLPFRPVDGAGEVLRTLAGINGSLLFVTARPDAVSIRGWMEELVGLDPGRIDIVATGSFEAKIDILKGREMTAFVEDRLETCFLLEAAGITPVLFRQPWNRGAHSFVEVGGWTELASLLGV